MYGLGLALLGGVAGWQLLGQTASLVVETAASAVVIVAAAWRQVAANG